MLRRASLLILSIAGFIRFCRDVGGHYRLTIGINAGLIGGLCIIGDNPNLATTFGYRHVKRCLAARCISGCRNLIRDGERGKRQ